MGRPPSPIEHHRRVGRGNGSKKADGRPLPDTLVVLPAAAGVPDFPVEFRIDGQRLWNQVWSRAITWLSPITDAEAITQTCQLVDDIAEARLVYRATRDPADARAIVALDKQLQSWLSSLGFNPAARSRLGLAEVKAASAIDRLLERQQQRRDPTA